MLRIRAQNRLHRQEKSARRLPKLSWSLVEEEGPKKTEIDRFPNETRSVLLRLEDQASIYFETVNPNPKPQATRRRRNARLSKTIKRTSYRTMLKRVIFKQPILLRASPEASAIKPFN